MTMRGGKVGMLLLVTAITAGLPLVPARTDGQAIVLRTVNVTCGMPGQTIASALRRQVLGGALLVRITGTCHEHVDIFRDDVILRGVSTDATIHGPTTTDQTVFIDGAKRVHLQGLIITGGSDGIAAAHGASFFVEDVTVHGAARDGVSALDVSSASVSGSVIRQSGRHGVMVSDASTAKIANSTIEANTLDGVQVGEASTATIDQNAIRGNGSSGIVIRGSTGNVTANTIEKNAGWGIAVRAGGADIGIRQPERTLAGNVVRENGLDGVLIAAGASGFLVGNTIAKNARHGVQLNLGVLRLNTGNTIEENAQDGVSMSGSRCYQALGFTVPPYPFPSSPDIVRANGRHGFSMFSASSLESFELEIRSNNGHGISLDGSIATLNNSIVADNAQDGLGLFPGSTARLANVTVVRNGADGLGVFQGSRATLLASQVRENARWGVWMFNNGSLFARDSAFSNNGRDGILAELGSSVELYGVTVIESNGMSGVSLTRASRLVASGGGTIRGNAEYGLICSGKSYAEAAIGFEGNGTDSSCLTFDD